MGEEGAGREVGSGLGVFGKKENEKAGERKRAENEGNKGGNSVRI